MDEAKAKWLQHAAMAKTELQEKMRLSVTSSCMKHDGCLLSQQSCDMAVISVDMGGKGEVAAAMDKVCSATDIIQATHNYTILCIFTFYVKLAKICQY
jgi:stage III sporulation protein SpoIIIAA